MASTAKVSVACALPHGLHLQNYKIIDTPQGRMATEVGPRVTLNGSNHPAAVAGFGITEEVDASFMDEWLRANGESDAVKNGLILVRNSAGAAQGEAKSRKGVKSGFEPLDPAKMPAELKAAVDKE